MMVTEVYEAFVAAGAAEDKIKAAQALASFDNRFNKVEADLSLLKWMTGLVIAGVVAPIIETFF